MTTDSVPFHCACVRTPMLFVEHFRFHCRGRFSVMKCGRFVEDPRTEGSGFRRSKRQHSYPVVQLRTSGPIRVQTEIAIIIIIGLSTVEVQCCPRYISDIVQTTAASCRRQGLLFHIQWTPTYTKFGEREFSVAGPSVWNSLPTDIRQSAHYRHLYSQASSQGSPFYGRPA